MGYVYDYVNGLYTTTYPEGAQRTYQIDPLYRLATVREEDDSMVAEYSYHSLESYFTLAYPNGLSKRLDYDALHRTTRVSSALADYRYGYDAASNRTYMERMHEAGSPADVYQYDKLYQVSQLWYGADAISPNDITSQEQRQVYEFDEMGNRLQVQNDGVSQSYLPNDGQQLTNPMNRYQQVDRVTFSYDLRGNTLSDGNNNYGYDILNRQISMNGPAGTAEYIYDALGRRLAKVVSPITTYYPRPVAPLLQNQCPSWPRSLKHSLRCCSSSDVLLGCRTLLHCWLAQDQAALGELPRNCPSCSPISNHSDSISEFWGIVYPQIGQTWGQ